MSSSLRHERGRVVQGRRTLGEGSRMRNLLTPAEEEEEREMAPEVKRPKEESTARARPEEGGGGPKSARDIPICLPQSPMKVERTGRLD